MTLQIKNTSLKRGTYRAGKLQKVVKDTERLLLLVARPLLCLQTEKRERTKIDLPPPPLSLSLSLTGSPTCWQMWEAAGQRMVGEWLRGLRRVSASHPPPWTDTAHLSPPVVYIYSILTIPLKKVIITESTREVLFLQTDWCQQLHMATTAPLPLPQRCSRRLRGQKPLSPSRQVEEEWSGASPTPPSGGSPLSGALP